MLEVASDDRAEGVANLDEAIDEDAKVLRAKVNPLLSVNAVPRAKVRFSVVVEVLEVCPYSEMWGCSSQPDRY